MIDPDVVKTHLKIDHNDEDQLIQSYTDAALSAFETWTNRKLIAPGGTLPDPVGNALIMSDAIKQGALLLIGQWYVCRESVISSATQISELPMATSALWKPHRWFNM